MRKLYECGLVLKSIGNKLTRQDNYSKLMDNYIENLNLFD